MKHLALVTLLAATALVGCSSYDAPTHNGNVSLEPAHNFLGIVKVEPGSYGEVSNTTVHLSMNDFVSRRANSGDRITLLWGAITITDY